MGQRNIIENHIVCVNFKIQKEYEIFHQTKSFHQKPL